MFLCVFFLLCVSPLCYMLWQVFQCNQCYQAFSTAMTLIKHKKVKHVFSILCIVRAAAVVPTVLYASSVLGPNSRFGIRIRSIVFPCTFSIALTSVSSTISIALTSEHSQLYFHVQCTFSIALRSGQSQMYSHVHSQ